MARRKTKVSSLGNKSKRTTITRRKPRMGSKNRYYK